MIKRELAKKEIVRFNEEKLVGSSHFFTSRASNVKSFEYSHKVILHGLCVNLNFNDLSLKETIKFNFSEEEKSSFSEDVKELVEVHWFSSQEASIEWNHGGDHHCRFDELNGKKMVLQRDFSCIHKSEKEIILITNPECTDGLFNFLRYIVPSLLLKQNKFVIHSSCITKNPKEASLFLGHSGFGKTTISGMFSEGSILGDDMHIVYCDNDEFFVEPTHLGQSKTQWHLQGLRYSLVGAFWLSKKKIDKKIKIEETSKTEQRLQLLGSLSGIFWDQLEQEDSDKVFNFVQSALNFIQIKKMHFSLNSEVEKYEYNTKL